MIEERATKGKGKDDRQRGYQEQEWAWSWDGVSNNTRPSEQLCASLNIGPMGPHQDFVPQAEEPVKGADGEGKGKKGKKGKGTQGAAAARKGKDHGKDGAEEKGGKGKEKGKRAKGEESNFEALMEMQLLREDIQFQIIASNDRGISLAMEMRRQDLAGEVIKTDPFNQQARSIEHEAHLVGESYSQREHAWHHQRYHAFSAVQAWDTTDL